MKGLKAILGFLGLVILLVAAWQNIPQVLEKDLTFKLDLYWVAWQTKPIPLYLILPICFLAGLALMWILDLGARLRLRRRIRLLEKELRSLRAEAGLPPMESSPAEGSSEMGVEGEEYEDRDGESSPSATGQS